MKERKKVHIAQAKKIIIIKFIESNKALHIGELYFGSRHSGDERPAVKSRQRSGHKGPCNLLYDTKKSELTLYLNIQGEVQLLTNQMIINLAFLLP